MKKTPRYIILIFVLISVTVFSACNKSDANISVSNTDILDIPFSLESYKEILPENIVLDYLFCDLTSDGVDELIVAYYTASNMEIDNYHGFSIWDSTYSCVGFSFDDTTLQYLQGSLTVNSHGNIELLLYNTTDKWDVEKIELGYTVSDGKQVITALNGTRYTLELYSD